MTERENILSLLNAVGIDQNNSISLSDGSIDIEQEYQLQPQDFIQFAEIDLEQEGDRSLVNALSNAKRAIDCRTDAIIEALKLSPSKIGLSKFNILKEIGVLAPRIITKIRNARNLLEHEYSLPGRSLVEDAVDVAILYEAASQRVFHIFPELIHIANKDCENGTGGNLFNSEVQILFEDDGFRLYGHKDNKRTDLDVRVSIDSDLYFPIMKVYITAHLERQKEKALKELYLVLQGGNALTRKSSGRKKTRR